MNKGDGAPLYCLKADSWCNDRRLLVAYADTFNFDIKSWYSQNEWRILSNLQAPSSWFDYPILVVSFLWLGRLKEAELSEASDLFVKISSCWLLEEQRACLRTIRTSRVTRWNGTVTWQLGHMFTLRAYNLLFTIQIVNQWIVRLWALLFVIIIITSVKLVVLYHIISTLGNHSSIHQTNSIH